MKCILPYSKCSHLLRNGNCQDGQSAPFNDDAKCARISGRKKMLIRSRANTGNHLYNPLPVAATKRADEIKVFVGNLCVARLEGVRDPLIKHIDWVFTFDYTQTIMGNNELDAVENVLKYLGYSD